MNFNFFSGGIVIAEDCQTEFGCITSLDFKPFESNFATLLVRARKSHPTPNLGHLIIKKAFGHITENHLECLTTINLDLRDFSQSKSPKSHSESNYSKKVALLTFEFFFEVSNLFKVGHAQ